MSSGPSCGSRHATTSNYPAADGPLVVVAPSTAQDPRQRLLRAALSGLADSGVRVLAATDRRPLSRPVRAGSGASLVNWLSYARTMPRASLVITHAGHGTLARALQSGRPVLAVPHSGDMGENAARVDWAGVGVRLPWRLLSATTLRLAVERALADPGYASRARELARWAAANDGVTRAAELVEELARRRRRSEPQPSSRAGDRRSEPQPSSRAGDRRSEPQPSSRAGDRRSEPQPLSCEARTNSISSGASPRNRSAGSP